MTTNDGADQTPNAALATAAASLVVTAGALSAHAVAMQRDAVQPDAATLLLASSAANLAQAAAKSLQARPPARPSSSVNSTQHRATKIVTAYERYLKACEPALKVLGVTELTESIITKGLTMQELFQLKRVNRFFKKTIESSVQLKRRMFLLSDVDKDNYEDFAVDVFNPLLKEFALVKLLACGHRMDLSVMDTDAHLSHAKVTAHDMDDLEHTTHFGGWQDVEYYLKVTRARGRSVPGWEKTKISARSMPVHIYIDDWRKQRNVVLPADSTIPYDLICKLHERGKAQQQRV